LGGLARLTKGTKKETFLVGWTGTGQTAVGSGDCFPGYFINLTILFLPKGLGSILTL